MFLNNLRRALPLFLLLFAAAGKAAPAPRTVALLLGDVESRPAVMAARSLKAELDAAGVAVRIIPANGMAAADRSALTSADALVLNIVARQTVQAISPELKLLLKARKPVFGVGGTLDESLLAQGIREDKALQAYYRAGGTENIANMIRLLMRTQFAVAVQPAPPRAMPEAGLYDVGAERVSTSFNDYVKGYARHKPGAPWIGVVFYRASLVAGQTLPLAAIASRLEQQGYNVLPVFGYPYETALRYLLDDAGAARVDLIVALGMKVGATTSTGTMLEKIGVPAINAITLSQQSAEQWSASHTGLDIIERSWQLSGAELAGLIQPTVVASRERVTDQASGLSYVEEQPIKRRVERLVARVDAWQTLRRTAQADKRIAMLYYNYPHGSETIGAAYLNVLPESLWQVAQRLKKEGYRTSLPADRKALQEDIQRFGSYPGKGGKEHHAALAQMAASGNAMLVPLSDYVLWYGKLPATLRSAVEKAWGAPEQAPTLWRDADGRAQFVFPARRYGNLLMAPQPTRAWERDLEKLHNDVTLPPSHEYIAFYLWLQHGYRANAVIHMGTHGTQEWLSGKEAGLDDDDPSEALIGAMPNIYPYVMDDVGEGLQAKRRGMATIIDHLTPPFDAAGLNPDLRELGALLNDYRVAEQKSPLLAASHLTALNRLALKSGVLKDMSRERIEGEEGLEALEEYLDTITAKLTPFGLHTFGVAPGPELRLATARAVANLDSAVKPGQRAARVERIADDISISADLELSRLMQALDGRYIPTGPSADLLRNPAALPTGRNFYGLDPSRIPSRTTYEQGAKLAQELVSDYRKRRGAYPDKLTINLWGVETSRHEGIMEAQVLALMGVRPTWDERGRVTGVEAISRAELGRPRVDVTMVSSGLFRDLFANLLTLLDDAARLAQRQPEEDNPLPRHSRTVAARLQQSGMPQADATALAGARVFGLPSGGYGTNIEKLIPLTNAWQNEKEVAQVFINRMSHPFGVAATLSDEQRREVFRQALSGSKIALHSRSSNLFATLDNDDFFQYLGGTALAIRSIDGKAPEVIVADLANPARPRHMPLARYMGQELQSRYLNPRWADSMLKEGYSGARFINRTVDYLWAWQVTVPEVVDAGKWQRMYETYVEDKHGLRVRERMAESGNLRAFQAITDRMLSAIERGYWQPGREVRARLEQENRSAMAQAGVACDAASCSRATLREAPAVAAGAPAGVAAATVATPSTPQPAGGSAAAAAPPPRSQPAKTSAAKPPAPKPAPVATPDNAAPVVKGFEMTQLATLTPTQKTIGALGLLGFAVLLMGLGYWRRTARIPMD